MKSSTTFLSKTLKVQLFYNKIETKIRANIPRKLIFAIFVSNQIEKGYIKIQYCPTDQMTADYLTKPLQGQNSMNFVQKF